MEKTLSTGGGVDSVEYWRAEEPAGEHEPYAAREEILYDAYGDTRCTGAGEEVEEKGRSDPCPKLLGEVDIERVFLGREVVRFVQPMGHCSEEWIGGVEVTIVRDRVDSAKENDGSCSCYRGISDGGHGGGRQDIGLRVVRTLRTRTRRCMNTYTS